MTPSDDKDAPIVYVDDEPALCRIFKLRMKSLGIRVETFTDPLVAIEYVNTTPVACVLCDYRMPGLSGLDVLARIEADVPFYLVTGDITVDDRSARTAGLHGVLPKPVRFEEVASLVRTGTRGRRD